MGDDTVKTVLRFIWGGLCIGAFIAYTVEFAYAGHKGNVGFVFLYIFMIVCVILGVVGAVLDNMIIAIVFAVLMSLFVILDGHYYSHFYALVIGQLVCGTAVAYALNGGGGGGK